ncbi:MAG: hypothetical protein AB1648_00520 [Pseudomonadota bacterium]
MSINFKKTAIAAGMFTALAATSMSANAMRVTEAGEANLVPFVIWTSDIFDPTPGLNSLFGLNTVVKITVPMSVGNDVIPNFFTAYHTSPTNGSKADPGKQSPADPDLVPANMIHWVFLNEHSEHLLNGTITVTPDDVAVLDWGAAVRKKGKQTELNGRPGYLVLVTEDGYKGNDADFSFFAEAWLLAGVRSILDPMQQDVHLNTGGVIGLIDAAIPVLPMSDGADNYGTPAYTQAPSVKNSVIEAGTNGSVIASPLVAGIRTNWSDGNGTDIGVVDVTLGNRNVPIGQFNALNFLQFPTLAVIWNDRNAKAWSSVLVDVFNDSEQYCSDFLELDHQLNLVWVQTDVTAGNNPFGLAWPVPGFIQAWGQDRALCVPSDDTPLPVQNGNIALEKLLSGGFLKMYLPEPIDTGIFEPESAMAAFSIPLQVLVTVETDAAGDRHFTDISAVPFSTALGHARGMFSQAP